MVTISTGIREKTQPASARKLNRHPRENHTPVMPQGKRKAIAEATMEHRRRMARTIG